MATEFKNSKVDVGITDTTLYVCPAATTAVVFNLYLANVDNTEAINITVKVWDDSDSTLQEVSGVDTPVPVGSALDFGKISLETGDEIRIIASKVDSITAFCNILQLT